MTTTQHSSGPWMVKGGNVIENESGVNIAKAWMTDREEECANARLIAAAPELLAALKSIKEWLDEPIDYQNLPQQIAWANGVAKATIAKAEGRTK